MSPMHRRQRVVYEVRCRTEGHLLLTAYTYPSADFGRLIAYNNGREVRAVESPDYIFEADIALRQNFAGRCRCGPWQLTGDWVNAAADVLDSDCEVGPDTPEDLREPLLRRRRVLHPPS